MCVAAGNRRNFTKNPYFGGSRSFKVIDVGTPRKARQQFVNRSHAKRANSGKITISYGVPLFDAFVLN